MDDFLDIKKQEARLKRLLRDFPKSDKKLINEALRLAKRKHGSQKRDEGTLYVIHPIRVACSLIEELGIKEPQIICGALLHDIYEDTDITLEEIKKRFGDRVLEIVRASTRNKTGETEQNKYQRKRQHILKIMKMDKYIRAMKSCDYLDNARSWMFIPKNHPSTKKFPRWFKEGKNLYLPLAKSVSSKIAEKMEKALSRAILRWKEFLQES